MAAFGQGLRRAVRRAKLGAAGAGARRGCARISAAKSAAFAAPLAPIASVPTGTPLGICTIESSAVEPIELGGRNRHAEDRHERLRRDHARQVGRAASAGNDNVQAAARRGLGILEEPVGRAVRGHDARFERDPKVAQ